MIVASVPHKENENKTDPEELNQFFDDLMKALFTKDHETEHVERAENKPAPVKNDPVDHPAHYTSGGIETIDFIEAKRLGFNLGNVVKYVTRAGKKDDLIQDLKKARWYLDREIRRLEHSL